MTAYDDGIDEDETNDEVGQSDVSSSPNPSAGSDQNNSDDGNTNPQSMGQQAKGPVATGLDDAKVKQMQDYLAQKFAKANDDSAIKSAMSDAADTNRTANIGSALESIARSNSMAHGGGGVDNSFYQGIKQEGQQGVQQATNMRQMAVQNFVTQNALNHQALDDMMKTGKYNTDQALAKLNLDKSNPDSDVSQKKVAALKSMFGRIPGMENIPWDGMSAVDADDIAKNADPLVRMHQIAQDKASMMAFRQDQINQRNEQQHQSLALKDLSSLGKDLDTQSATTRTNLGQAQQKVNSAERLMTFADVNQDALAQAKADPAAKTALIQKLNNLTPQQYTEVVSGLMSQVANGQGSFGQLEHMRANTSDQTAANIKQFFTSNPAPANVGALIYNNLMTLKNEADTSQSVLDRHLTQMRSKHPSAFTHDYTKDDAERMLSTFTNPQDKTVAMTPPSQTPRGMMASELPADRGSLVAGQTYKLKNGQIGTFNGSGFVPLVAEPQTAVASGQ